MTLYINGYKNTNFQKFVDFADTKVKIRKGNTIARLDDIATGLGGHVITAHTEDGVGGLSAFFRSKAKKAVNNATRESFKQAIIDLFGGTKKVPDSVLDAMKLEDYDKGKPLTAHRIMVVKRAVDNVKKQFDEAVQKAKNNAKNEYYKTGDERNAQMDALISKTIASCMQDSDLLDVVVDNMATILVGGDGKHRSEQSVQKRIDNLKANYRELRKQALDNPSVLEPGKFFIAALNGKPIPKGMIKTMIEEANKIPINELTKLSSSSTGYDIHKAMNQFRNGLNDIVNKADVENLMDGPDEKVACRNFAIKLLMARCGKDTLRKIQATLNGETAAKTLKLYKNIDIGNFDNIPNNILDKTKMSQGHIRTTRDQGGSHENYFMQLKQVVDEACGIPENEIEGPEAYEWEFSYDEIDGDKIVKELVNEGRKQLATKRENYLANAVQGTGQGVTELRAVIENKIGPDAYEPREIMRKNARPIVKNMINLALAADCKRFAENRPEDTMFYKSLVGGMVVKLVDGKQLSNDFATARDEITRFVTGDANATYAEADEKTKAKTHVVMSLLSQATMKAAVDGYATAFDPNNANPAFNMAIKHDPKAWEFTLEMHGGVLFINFEAKLDINGFSTILDNNEKKIETGEGSKYTSKFKLQINKKELNRLAGLEYKNFNEEEANSTFNAEDKATATNTLKSLGDFMLDNGLTSCDTTFSVTLN